MPVQPVKWYFSLRAHMQRDQTFFFTDIKLWADDASDKNQKGRKVDGELKTE